MTAKETNNKFAFKASLESFRIDREGEAKLALAIPQKEVAQMADLARFNNRLFLVAIVVTVPLDEEGNNEDDEV